MVDLKLILVVLMNNATLFLSESIRTIASDKLFGNISLARMQGKLIGLFVDWNANDVNDSDSVFGDYTDGMKRIMQFSKCESLNDERTIEFHQGWKQESDVFDESRQIWIPYGVDPINDDMFIPRDDAQ